MLPFVYEVLILALCIWVCVRYSSSKQADDDDDFFGNKIFERQENDQKAQAQNHSEACAAAVTALVQAHIEAIRNARMMCRAKATCCWIPSHSFQALVMIYELVLSQLTNKLTQTLLLLSFKGPDVDVKSLGDLLLKPALDMVLAAILQGNRFMTQFYRPLVATPMPSTSALGGMTWLVKAMNASQDAIEVHLHNFMVAYSAVGVAVKSLFEQHMPEEIDKNKRRPEVFWTDLAENWFRVFPLRGEMLDRCVKDDEEDFGSALWQYISSFNIDVQDVQGGSQEQEISSMMKVDDSTAKLADFVRHKRKYWARQTFEKPINFSFLNMSELKRLEDAFGTNDMGTIIVRPVTWGGTVFALKFFEKSAKEKFEGEANIQVRLHHPNVLSAVALFKTVDEHQHGILLELMDENLEAYLKSHASKLSWQEKVSILLQMAKGLEYMHRRGVMHRDIKPPNVLVRKPNNYMDISMASTGRFQQQLDMEVKIIDFGESKASLAKTKRIGTDVYRAPEVLRSIEDESSYERSMDVFSFAMTAYRVLLDKEPFEGYEGKREGLWRKVMAGERPDLASVDDAACPPYLKHCLKTWWAQDPKTRHSFTHICCILRHLYICLVNCQGDVDPTLQYPFLTWPLPRWKRAQDSVKRELRKLELKLRADFTWKVIHDFGCESTRVNEIPYEMHVMEWALSSC